MSGQQNFLDLKLSTYLKKSYEFLKESSKLFFYNKKFGIGQKIDKDKLRHYQLISHYLCTDEESLLLWINDKISGELSEKKCCNKFEPCYNKIISCDLNECFKWEKVEW